MLAGAGARVRATPVLDGAGMAPVDAYEIPARLWEAVHLIHPADVFPFAANTTRRVISPPGGEEPTRADIMVTQLLLDHAA